MIPNLDFFLHKQRRAYSAAVIAGLVGLAVIFYFNRFPHSQKPSFLSFSELRKFAKNPHPGFFLEKKLESFWKTPIISNAAYYSGIRPHRPSDPQIGPYLRIVSWNIEKSIRMEDAITAFTPKAPFAALINPDKVSEGSSEYQH